MTDRNAQQIVIFTGDAIDDPAQGDRFLVHAATWWSWLWVLYVAPDGGPMVVLLPQLRDTNSGELHVFDSVTEFRRRFTLIDGGCWVQLEDRGNDVEGWLDYLYEPETP